MSARSSSENETRCALTQAANVTMRKRYCASCNSFRELDPERPGRTRLLRTGRRIWRCAACCAQVVRR